MSKEYKMLINGELVGAPETLSVTNPATGKIIAEVPQITPEQVELALAGAQQGFNIWSKTSLAERSKIIIAYAEILEAHKDEIIDILISETGKPYDNAEYDFGMLVTCLRYFVEEAKRTDQPTITDPSGRFLHYISRQPLGVVVGYLAWNFPLLNVGYKLGPSLASGCSAIIKPSQATPLASLRVAELAIEAGIPAGVINVITGDRYDVTNPLLTSPITSMFTMIGSTRAGVGAMRTACTSVKHFSVELGGNAPVLVYADADLDKAVNDIVDLKFSNSGQVCVSPNRCFVHESIYDEFVLRAKERAQGIVLTSGRGEGRLMGPIISATARDNILTNVKASVSAGAKLITGGDIPADKKEGFFMEPTILADVTVDMPIACDEIFGPVLPIIKYTDSDDIIALANDNIYGLAAYVYTTNLKNAMQAAEQIQAGSVCVNEVHYDIHLPHGGLKQSGVGKDCSHYSLEEYLTLKRVSILVNE
ncbi:NAD-dependent succinate-semialdehyde dehydrogenase [Saccharophagus degradans]|uniref:NAD-dependent succinate-semialdehyde dehydrogenase n=1 Tax=Saccharophagus degradans TaxID=86304 RepID=A0AAW7XEC0_9GAMM|nr:NAD-dependent succinate-semialdehyde dehydrogenase [Saccharophagus degradans]MBU2986621.1 NAD-dependent succinate-semialdehyde dehydrogenase [Saccharophagus degradans]MDO6424767.1 NAD-dependent succinate-semialdehyde dehydrogenase [Saccharophagus degradans]MDO6609481.1 NAD-dependent succinate-semialdehyde dehydrogenase [Saccharophagus degradans]